MPSIKQTEAEFLSAYDPTVFERPSLAVDVVLLSVMNGDLAVALYKRAVHPEIGTFALPGGFVRMHESLEETAQRVLRDKLGLDHVFIEQLYSFSAPERDPRTRIVSIAHFALVASSRFDSLETFGACWGTLRVEAGRTVVLDRNGGVFPLFIDHSEILDVAVRRIRGKIDDAPVGYSLLGETFSLRQLQSVHEAVLGKTLNKDSFRRRILAGGDLAETGTREHGVSNRPAKLYRFVSRSWMGGVSPPPRRRK